jgi:quercetin dioxygenase-like cupin family protein
MNERKGEVFSIAAENAPVFGCTVSKAVAEVDGRRISHFALASGTDISPETYGYNKLWFFLSGEGEVLPEGGVKIGKGDAFVTPAGVPVGIKAKTDVIYTEIETGKEHAMKLTTGEVFALKDILPIAEGRIVNMDLINEPKLKFVLMSFAAGTGLSEHAAPGDALIFALEGEGVIGYEGRERTLKAGENFVFAKDGAHWVRAVKPFKMALLLTLD